MIVIDIGLVLGDVAAPGRGAPGFASAPERKPSTCWLCGEVYTDGDLIALAYRPEADYIDEYERDICLVCARTPDRDALVARMAAHVGRLRASDDDALQYRADALEFEMDEPIYLFGDPAAPSGVAPLGAPSEPYVEGGER